MDIIKKGVCYLIPSNAERQIKISNDNSNFAYYGLFVSIRNHRNMLYYTTVACGILFYYKFKKVAMVCWLGQMGCYFSVISRYSYYI
jgi:hypothetical protein